MALNRYLLKKEKAFQREMYKFFIKSRKQVQALLRKQDTTKDFGVDLRNILQNIAEGTATIIAKRSKSALIKGAGELADLNPSFLIDWDLRNDPAVKYISDIINAHSDTGMIGSIGKTTYVRVMEMVEQALIEGFSYTEVADNIEKLDPFVFSPYRAKNIAVTELGTAYEKGKYLPMQDLQNKGEIVLKKWSTVRDEKVRPTHFKNELDGYIPLDIPFSGTGSMIPPADMNCRCACIYHIGKGTPPKEEDELLTAKELTSFEKHYSNSIIGADKWSFENQLAYADSQTILSENEAKSIILYTGHSESYDLNKYLRNPKTYNTKQEGFNKLLTNALAKTPINESIIYRGIPYNEDRHGKIEDFISNLKEHGYSDDGFMSFSKNPFIAHQFTSAPRGGGIIFKVNKGGKDLENLASFETEQEILFNKGQDFKVKKVTYLKTEEDVLNVLEGSSTIVSTIWSAEAKLGFKRIVVDLIPK